MNIFKAYDIRGKYPDELDEKIAIKIGYATAKFLKAKTVVMGHDVRKSAPQISQACAEGLSRYAEVIYDIGLCTTPMIYFATAKNKFDAGIMITASHNPPEYIGLKICYKDAVPIGEQSGLKEIQNLCKTDSPITKRGSIKNLSILDSYKSHVLDFLGKTTIRPLKIAVDTANGSVGPFFQEIFEGLKLRLCTLCFNPDGSFPNHEPDPLKEKNTQDLQERILKDRADFGIAFDGDGDRAVFLDEKGARIPGDFVTCLLARQTLVNSPGEKIVYDLRSSKVVKEEIERLGGIAVRERVGHAFFKQTMRRLNAAFGGELSGHYYFRENYFAECAIITFARFLSLVSTENIKVSELVNPLKRYCKTGEINFLVNDQIKASKDVLRNFSKGKQDYLDGLTVEFPEFWFNLRPSNTEPLLRLNLEAKSKEILEDTKQKIINILGEPIS